MNTQRRFITASALGASALLPMILYAHSYGPPPRVTGAPGDSAKACTQCHTGTLNTGGGKVEILLPGGPAYTPGVKQHITVRITDDAQKRWGFEFSARLNSDLSNGQAGDLASTDSLTQVFCDSGSAPCGTGIQFISHNTDGTRNGTAGPVTFEFDWTPPASDAGPVTLYVAANAANGNGSSSGDHIYTANVQLSPAVQQKPTIKSDGGVTSAATFQPVTIAPNSWVTIFGSNLAPTSRLWRADEIQNGNLPKSLDNVGVTINGKPAYVEFISPGQINVLAPDDTSTGPVQVKLTTAAGSDTFTAQYQTLTPGLFQFDGVYLAATHADGSLIGKGGLFPSAPAATTPAKPGETVILYGTGFGATTPSVPAGVVNTQIANCNGDLVVTIGGAPAKVSFAGMIPNYAGLYQFNVEVPASAANGDQQVIAKVAGVSSPSSLLTVQK